MKWTPEEYEIALRKCMSVRDRAIESSNKMEGMITAMHEQAERASAVLRTAVDTREKELAALHREIIALSKDKQDLTSHLESVKAQLKRHADMLEKIITETEQWNYAVQCVIGRIPDTGICYKEARALVAEIKEKKNG